jgi:uncharacterized protein
MVEMSGQATDHSTDGSNPLLEGKMSAMKISFIHWVGRIWTSTAAIFFLAAVSLTAAWLPATAGAEIYRWQDAQGYWHFSEGPGPQSQSSPPAAGPAAPARPAQTPAPVTPAQSHAPAAAKTSAALSRSGLLWRIHTAGKQPSYLLGTIHSTDPRVTQLRSSVAAALDGSDRFVMEMKMDTQAFMQFGASMMLGPDSDLESLLGRPLFDQVLQAMKTYGMPETVVRQLKPWAVVAMLSMPKPEGGLILDMVLYQRAAGQGKPTSGLESAAEQLAVFEGLSLHDQIELLKMTLKSLPSQPQMFEQLIEAYAADDLDRIIGIARSDPEQSRSAAGRRFMTRLNDDRNRRMVRRIVPYLEQGNSFIAVGALHLAGPRGILALLRQKGYTTDPVP